MPIRFKYKTLPPVANEYEYLTSLIGAVITSTVAGRENGDKNEKEKRW